jgi:hypothetical protein
MSINAATNKADQIAEQTRVACQTQLKEGADIKSVLREAAAAISQVSVTPVAAVIPDANTPVWVTALNQSQCLLNEDSFGFQYGYFGLELFVQNQSATEEEVKEFTKQLADAFEFLAEEAEIEDDGSECEGSDERYDVEALLKEMKQQSALKTKSTKPTVQGEDECDEEYEADGEEEYEDEYETASGDDSDTCNVKTVAATKNKLQKSEKRLMLLTALAIAYPFLSGFCCRTLLAMDTPMFLVTISFYAFVASPLMFVVPFCLSVKNFFDLLWQNVTFAGWQRYAVTITSALLNVGLGLLTAVFLFVLFMGAALTNGMNP